MLGIIDELVYMSIVSAIGYAPVINIDTIILFKTQVNMSLL